MSLKAPLVKKTNVLSFLRRNIYSDLCHFYSIQGKHEALEMCVQHFHLPSQQGGSDLVFFFKFKLCILPEYLQKIVVQHEV